MDEVEPSALVALVAVALLAGWLGLTLRRRGREPWHRARTPLARARTAQVIRFEGVVATDEPAMRSPVEGRPCVAFHAVVEHFDQTMRRQRAGWWDVAAVETEVVRFRVIDDDGHAATIDPARAEVELHFEPGDPRPSRWEAVEPMLSRAGDPRLLRERALRHLEIAFEPGARVAVVARVARPPSGHGAVYRAAPRDAELEAADDALHVKLLPPASPP